MYAFKNIMFESRKFIGLASIFMLILASGCSIDPPKDKPNSDSQKGSFYVKSFSGFAKSDDFDASGMTNARIYEFKVCLKDYASNKDVKNHSFIISGAKETIPPKRTDESGCFSWNERIEFDPGVIKSKFIKMRREIISDGIQRGSDFVLFAINPWQRSPDEKKIYDLKDSNLVPGGSSSTIDEDKGEDKGEGKNTDKKLLISENQSGARLWIESLSYVDLSEGNLTKEKGYKSELEIHFKPSLKTKNVYGQWKLIEYPAGKFIVKPYIIVKKIENNKEVREVMSISDEEKTVEMSVGIVKLRTSIYIPILPTSGDLEVGLIVKPVTDKKSNNSTRPFHGVFHMKKGKLKQIVQDEDQKYSSSRFSFDLNEYVDTDANFIKNTFAAYKEHKKKSANLISEQGLEYMKYFDMPEGWEVNKYSVGKLVVKFQSYKNMVLPEQDVIFNITACVKNLFTKRNMKSYKFKIHKIRESKDKSSDDKDIKREVIIRPAKDKGCFQWSDKIRYKVYDREHYHKRTFILENDSLGIKEEIPIAINPWDFGFTFGQDLRYNEELIAEKEGEWRKKPPSEVWLPGFSYRNIGFDYKIDQNLNMTLRKHLIIRIDPMFRAFHSITRTKPFYYLYPGYYLLKLVLMRNFYEDAYHAGEYISHVTKLVEVSYGRILTTVTFDIDNIRIMGSRNIILAEIFPIYEDKVKIDDDTGLIVPRKDDLRIDENADMTLEERVEKEAKWDAELVAKDSGLTPKSYIGPIIILNEFGGSSALPSSVSSRLNSLSKNNVTKIIKSKDGSHLMSKEVAEQFLKYAKSNTEFINEEKIDAPENYEENFIMEENGDHLFGCDKSDRKKQGSKIKSFVGSSESNGFQNSYLLDKEKSSDQNNLLLLINCGKGMDENGKKVKKCVNLKKSESEVGYVKYKDERTGDWKIGYAPPPYDVNTTEMIERGVQIEKLKEGMATEGAKLEYFLDQNNLSYLKLNDDKKVDDFLSRIANPLWHMEDHKYFYCYFTGVHFNHCDNQFYNKDRVVRKEKLDKINLVDLVNKGTMSPRFTKKLCNWWFKDFLRTAVDGVPDIFKTSRSYFPGGLGQELYDEPIDPTANRYLAMLCKKNAKKPWLSFSIERKIRAFSLKEFKHQKGLSVNATVNSGVTWDYGESSNKSSSWNYGISTSIKDATFGKLALPINVSGGYTRSVSRGEKFASALKQGNGNSINLVIQRNEFDLVFGSYEKCVSVKLNPFAYRLAKANLDEDYADADEENVDEENIDEENIDEENVEEGNINEEEDEDNPNMNNLIYAKSDMLGDIMYNQKLKFKDRANIYSKGLFICTGKPVNKEKQVTENYYYITQHFNVGHSFDMPSIKNRWFDVAIRGEQTLTNLMSLMYTEQLKKIDDQEHEHPLGRTEHPLYVLLPIYRTIPTSFYKIYSLPVNPKTFDDYKWNPNFQ